MTKIAKISLDIRKNDVVDNEPIILRQGDSDVIIEASISNDGYPDIEIEFATFVAKKSDGTIISNDPVNISGNVISYPVSKHLTESVGKIQDAYFMINNKITTCSFDISIIPSAQLDDTSVNYIPGIESINKFLESAEAGWLGRIQKMKAQIDGLDIPKEFKLLMDKALGDAKDQYQPTIDAAEENVENIVADLAAKKLDLENNSDELNKTVATIKAQVASVTTFLDSIQKQIIDANSSFTAGQQAKISQSIADSQKKLADSIASMQNNQSAAMAKVNQDIADTKAIMQKMQNVAVGTNLYQDTRDFDNPDIWTDWSNWRKTGEKINGLTVMATDGAWEGLLQTIQAKKGETYTYSVYARYQSGAGRSFVYPSPNQVANTDTGSMLVSLNETWQRVTWTGTITADGPISPRIERANLNDNILLIAGPKLEKGPTATDYSLNPLDVATDGSVQTEIAKQIKANQPDLSNYPTRSEMATAIKELQDKISQADSGVRTNLYQDSRDFNNPSLWNNWRYWHKTGEKFNGLTVMTPDIIWNALSQTVQAEKGMTYTFSVYARCQSGTGTFRIYFTPAGKDRTNIFIKKVSLSTTWQRVTATMTLNDESTISAGIAKSEKNDNTLFIAGPKLEKGSIATDYSLNPLDISTSEDVQTAVTNALSTVDVGKTITAADDTGKTVKLKITGIS